MGDGHDPLHTIVMGVQYWRTMMPHRQLKTSEDEHGSRTRVHLDGRVLKYDGEVRKDDTGNHQGVESTTVVGCNRPDEFTSMLQTQLHFLGVTLEITKDGVLTMHQTNYILSKLARRELLRENRSLRCLPFVKERHHL